MATSKRKKLTDLYFALREQKDNINAQLKDLNKNIEDVEGELVRYMENENMQSFNDTDFGTVFLRTEVYASVEDPAALYPWLKANDMSDVIKQTVHFKTLSAIVKDHNLEVPGVKAHLQVRIGFRKGGE